MENVFPTPKQAAPRSGGARAAPGARPRPAAFPPPLLQNTREVNIVQVPVVATPRLRKPNYGACYGNCVQPKVKRNAPLQSSSSSSFTMVLETGASNRVALEMAAKILRNENVTESERSSTSLCVLPQRRCPRLARTWRAGPAQGLRENCHAEADSCAHAF